MSFSTSIRTCLSKYAVFSGRARRSEYWWFALFTFVVQAIFSAGDNSSGHTFFRLISSLIGLALLLPTLGVAVRRLHDGDHSGWWILIGLIPLIGTIVLLVFLIKDGTPGDNRFGPSPKYPAAMAAPAW